MQPFSIKTGRSALLCVIYVDCRRSQLPRSLRGGSAAAPSLGLRIRIPSEARMSVTCDCCVLSGKGFSAGPFSRPEESYWVCVYLSIIRHNSNLLHLHLVHGKDRLLTVYGHLKSITVEQQTLLFPEPFEDMTYGTEFSRDKWHTLRFLTFVLLFELNFNCIVKYDCLLLGRHTFGMQ